MDVVLKRHRFLEQKLHDTAAWGIYSCWSCLPTFQQIRTSKSSSKIFPSTPSWTLRLPVSHLVCHRAWLFAPLSPNLCSSRHLRGQIEHVKREVLFVDRIQVHRVAKTGIGHRHVRPLWIATNIGWRRQKTGSRGVELRQLMPCALLESNQHTAQPFGDMVRQMSLARPSVPQKLNDTLDQGRDHVFVHLEACGLPPRLHLQQEHGSEDDIRVEI